MLSYLSNPLEEKTTKFFSKVIRPWISRLKKKKSLFKRLLYKRPITISLNFLSGMKAGLLTPFPEISVEQYITNTRTQRIYGRLGFSVPLVFAAQNRHINSSKTFDIVKLWPNAT